MIKKLIKLAKDSGKLKVENGKLNNFQLSTFNFQLPKAVFTFAEVMKKFPPFLGRVRVGIKQYPSQPPLIRGGALAFTLAEVLITLGVIGVVAAMTLPTLIQNHKRHVVETRLEKFYSAINQAIVMSELENGDKKDWDDIGTGEDALNWYNKYLAKYLKTVKVELSNVNKVNIYFSDGSMLAISSTSFMFYPKASDYQEILNEEGVAGLNMSNVGRKQFTFTFAPNNVSNKWLYDKGVEPYKYSSFDGTETALRNDNRFGCKEGVTNSPAYCTALIQVNGWKIPKDYPFRF